MKHAEVVVPYVLRKFNCVECGQYAERKLSSKQPRRCVECGLASMVRSALQMNGRTGPAWHAWQASNGPRGRPRTRESRE